MSGNADNAIHFTRSLSYSIACSSFIAVAEMHYYATIDNQTLLAPLRNSETSSMYCNTDAGKCLLKGIRTGDLKRDKFVCEEVK